MARIKANGIQLEYMEYGNPDDPAIVFVGGWSVQLIFWPQELIDAVVSQGFRVIVFDNRDVGHSQKMWHFPPTSPLAGHVLLARFLGSRRLTAYTLEDMAEDTVGLLDALGIEQAHILGLSMGGMITQIAAAKHPDRFLSATILMSSTNRLDLPKPPLSLLAHLLFSPRFLSRNMARRRSERIWRKIRTQDGGYEDSTFKAGVSSTIDRSHSPAGRMRQMEAIFATGDLRRFAKRISTPTLVIHGTEDPLAPVEGGQDIAASIPQARLELIEGMGHDLPPKYLGRISSLVTGHLASMAGG